jgi:hypothetical protein
VFRRLEVEAFKRMRPQGISFGSGRFDGVPAAVEEAAYSLLVEDGSVD